MAIQGELVRLFGREWLEENGAEREELLADSPLLTAGRFPHEVTEVARTLVFDDYAANPFPRGPRKLMLFGIDTLEELHAEDGLVHEMITEGFLPAGVVEFGEDLLLDTRGELGTRSPGAVYLVMDYAIDGATWLAPSLEAFLSQLQPLAEDDRVDDGDDGDDLDDDAFDDEE